MCFWFFTKNFTLSLPVTRCAGDNTDLHSNSNNSETIRQSIAFTSMFLKEDSIGFLMISRLMQIYKSKQFTPKKTHKQICIVKFDNKTIEWC